MIRGIPDSEVVLQQPSSRRAFLKRLGALSLLPVAHPVMNSFPVPGGLLPESGSLLTSDEEPSPERRYVRFGAWQPPRSIKAVADLEESLGRGLDIVHWYQGWGDETPEFDVDYASAVTARGAQPLVTWEPWDYREGREQPRFALRQIVAGRFDGYARAWARSLADFESPVLLRFAHEMNGTAYPWSLGVNGNRPAEYRAAWRRLVGIFRNEGATNVSWVWCPLVLSPGAPPLESCFPGDEYVDVVGLDGYNAGTAADWGGWLSFTEVFGPLYEQVRELSDRPVIVAETACAELGGSKPQWIADAFLSELPERFPAIEAVVWFNEPREADWRLDSSSAALATARAVFRSRDFTPES